MFEHLVQAVKMTSFQNFSIIVDLSHFFNDHRSRVKIFIDQQVKTIKDLEAKLGRLFQIEEVHLTSDKNYLPALEDVRILQPGEVIV